MVPISRIAAPLIWLTICLCWPGQSPAAGPVTDPGSCALPSDWEALATRARLAARAGQSPPEELRQGIAADLRRLDAARLFEQVAHIQSDSTRLRIEAVLESLHAFAATGSLDMPVIVALDLHEIDKTVAQYCSDLKSDRPEMHSRFKALGHRFGLGGGEGDPDLVDYLRLALLPVAAGVLSAAVFLFGHAIGWMQTLFYRRKLCRIPAVLIIGTYSVPGTVTMLGRNGCRFVGQDQEARDLLGDIAESAETRVTAGEVHIPSHLASVHPTHALVLFQMPLPRSLQNRLFSCSAIRPQFARHRPFDRTVPQRPGGTPAPAFVDRPGRPRPA